MNGERHLSAFQREYLRELEVPHKQMLMLAEAIPEEAYTWRPAEDARTFSAVLVHTAAGNLTLLARADVMCPAVMDLYGAIEEEGIALWMAMIHKSLELEKTLTAKQDVLHLAERSFEAVHDALIAISEEELGHVREMYGERTTYRRIYLRILAHADEHMGQAIAYGRAMGFHVPWPDPIAMLDQMTGGRR